MAPARAAVADLGIISGAMLLPRRKFSLAHSKSGGCVLSLQPDEAWSPAAAAGASATSGTMYLLQSITFYVERDREMI